MKDITRRKVLQGASAFTIVGAQQVRGTQANSKVSVGLIGAGNRGSYDAENVHKDPRSRITAVCDAFSDRIEAAMPKFGVGAGDTYTDFEKMIARSDLDAVLIASPPFEHPRMFDVAVEARKHIYCEKPMGVDVAGCKKMRATGKKADPSKSIFVGFQQRHGPVYLEAWKRIQDGQIGAITKARGWWLANDPFTRKPYADPKIEKLRNWYFYRELSGDILVEQDCHNFDVFHWYLGLPLRAVGYAGAKVRKNCNLMDHLSLSIEYPNEVYVNYEANQLTPRGFNRVGEEFTGEKGTIAVSRLSMTHYKAPTDKPPSDTIKSPRDITIDALEAWITSIVNNKPENFTERSVLSTMSAIMCRTALYTRKEQTWKGMFGS